MAASVRPFPYPYRSLVAIANDNDGMSFADFVEIHGYLNTYEETDLGPGLGLDVSDSFWFYSAKPDVNDSFTYFDGLTTQKTAYAPVIKELVELGILDTLHSWGNFSQRGGFHRSHAEEAAREMEGWKRKPLVWTNHGDVHNLQNLHTGLGDLTEVRDGTGTRQQVLEYHSDILQNLGFCFAWRASDVTPVWGQGRSLSPGEYVRHQGTNVGATLPRRGLNWLRAWRRSSRPSEIWQNLPLRDGSSMLFFRRYLRSWENIRGEDLQIILTPVHLDELVERKAVALVLTHFGFGQRFPTFSPEQLQVFRILAKRKEKGDVLVMSTERYLLFHYVRDHMISEVDRAGSTDRLTLRWPPQTPPGVRTRGFEALDGLTFYCERPQETKVFLEEHPLPFQVNPPDETRRPSLTLTTRDVPVFPYRELKKLRT